MTWTKSGRRTLYFFSICLSAFGIAPIGRAQAPVFDIVPVQSWVKFHVKSSVTIAGKFDKWDASLTFKSLDETTGLLEIKINAASVDTGSGMKNSKLKDKDFFDADQNPYITFKSTKIVPTGPHSYEVRWGLHYQRSIEPREINPDHFR